MVPWWGVIIVIIVIGYAVFVGSDEEQPCRNCKILLDPEADYRRCLDCEKVKK
ncbi:hypothetical protein SDC9_170913 [bioreactor metagenome]|uniref:Uncharacterized protein n=1 Tax=bioreactor metagenome TaxID=1076179 RepID=A0A645GI46_9ZZZZ